MLSLLKGSKELHLNVPMVPTTDYINTISQKNEPEFPVTRSSSVVTASGSAERGGHRPPRSAPRHRRRRPHLPPTPRRPPCTRWASTTSSRPRRPLRRRPDLHPGPRLPRRLRPRVPRGSPHRGAARRVPSGEVGCPQRHPSYPHPVSCRSSGSSRRCRWVWARSTPSTGDVEQVPRQTAASRTSAARRSGPYLGDGEMDEVESRGQLSRGERGPRQPQLHHQLQPPAPRRPGPRQRQDHPGARELLPRCRLERHQGRLGPRVGRPARPRHRGRRCSPDEHHARRRLPDLQGRERRVRPRELLRTRPPRLELVKDYTDEQVWGLKRGGHDYRKVYAAFKAAAEHKGQPTVHPRQDHQGLRPGPHFEGRNATHQMKKLTLDDSSRSATRWTSRSRTRSSRTTPTSRRTTTPARRTNDPVHAGASSFARRVPARASHDPRGPGTARDAAYALPKKGSGTQDVATTMAFVRLLKDLLRVKGFGHRIVPIIPDEARTFGMDAYFPTRRSTTPRASTTPPSTASSCWRTRRAPRVRSSTSASTRRAPSRVHRGGHGVLDPRRAADPVYVFYSMFGFQRTGDAQWAAATRWRAASSSAPRPAAPR